MSVSLIDKGEFARVAQTIKFNPDLLSSFPSLQERMTSAALKTPVAISEENIYAFAERLYIANRLAYEYQYGDNETITIPRLTRRDMSGMMYTLKEFINTLRLIRYNLYTNNGRCFLGQEDMERIDRLLNTAQRKYIEQLEEELERR